MMKKNSFFKKITAIGLSFILCFTLSCTTAFAASTPEITVQTYSQQFMSVASVMQDDNFEEITALLRNGWDNFSDKIMLDEYNFTSDEIFDIYLAAVYSSPDYFYVPTSLGIATSTVNGVTKVAYVIPHYLATKDEVANMQTKYDAAVDKMLGKIESGMSDFDKVLTIHDELAQICQYDQNYYLNLDIGDNSYTSYGALVDGNAVCQGYTLAFNSLLGRLGIETSFASSGAMNHIWSMVKLQDSYYHVDCTLDDSRMTSGKTYYDISGNVSHRYFLLNDTEMLKNDHYDWVAPQKSTSTVYSNSFFRNLDADTEIYVNNGNYYYINNAGNIIKRNEKTANETAVYTIKKGMWNETDTNYTVWSPAYSKLALSGDKLYFLECKDIMSISLSNLVVASAYKPELKNEECLFGLKFLDSNLVYDKRNISGAVTQYLPTDIFEEKKAGFSVEITDSNGNVIEGTTFSGESGDTFGISVIADNPVTDDEYTIEPSNPYVADYDEDSGEIVLVEKGTAQITITSVADSSNSVTLTFISKGVVELIYGDVNGDNTINSKDVLNFRKHLAGITTGVVFYDKNSDVNADGTINTKDVLLLRKYLAGWSVVLGPQSK